MKTVKTRSSLACLLLLALLPGATLTARAATLVVTNLADSGPGTLRDAIAFANTNAGGADITFDPALSGKSIVLTSSELVISNNLTIDASALAGGIAIDAGKNSRVLEIAAGNVTLNSLMLTNGFVSGDGGGILVDADATLIADNSTIGGNSANGGGGIRTITGSTVTLNNCILSDNFAGSYGGGIFNNDTFTLNNCILSDNSTVNAFGGGIFDNGGSTITLNNCTLSGNSAGYQGEGGGIDIYFGTAALNNCTFSSNSAADGGGIFNIGSAILNNCTLFDNSGSNGGGIANSGTLTVNNCTLFGNFCDLGEGGGIYNQDVLTLNNCTLSGNSAYGGGGILLTSGTLTPLLTNTIVAGNAATYDANISGDFSGVDNLTNGDPRLAPLGDYGGPTQTMPPLAGSPAIDAGLDSVTNRLTTDQRGYPRKSGAHVDIGAVELQTAPADNPLLLMNAAVHASGALSFSFTNIPDADFTVLASTNVALPLGDWIQIGNTVQNPPGQYQFTDPGATNYPQRFYQVVSP